MKKYINTAFAYGVAALICGVIYREVTKFYGFTGKTTLAFMHLHLFVLGMIMFLILALFAQLTDIEKQKAFQRFIKFYHVSLPFMVLMFFVRGMLQVAETDVTKGVSAAISGLSGVSHILMAVAFLLLFAALRKCRIVTKQESES